VKRHDLLAHLKAHGCQLVREGAKHSWWGNPQNRRRSAAARHSEINNLLARKICRDLGIREP
jgi:mRNA interferase HicA